MSKFSIIEGGTLANQFLVESIFFHEEKLPYCCLVFLRTGTLVNQFLGVIIHNFFGEIIFYRGYYTGNLSIFYKKEKQSFVKFFLFLKKILTDLNLKNQKREELYKFIDYEINVQKLE